MFWRLLAFLETIACVVILAIFGMSWIYGIYTKIILPPVNSVTFADMAGLVAVPFFLVAVWDGHFRIQEWLFQKGKTA